MRACPTGEEQSSKHQSSQKQHQHHESANCYEVDSWECSSWSGTLSCGSLEDARSMKYGLGSQFRSDEKLRGAHCWFKE